MQKDDPKSLLRQVQAFFLERVQWFTRLAALLIFVIIVLNAIIPNFVEILSGILNFSQPSLASLIGLAILLFLVERVVLIEDMVRRPPLCLHETKRSAYSNFLGEVPSQKARNIDFLQFSGFSALDLIREVAERYPKSKIRILLYHPDQADSFDSDKCGFHSHRIHSVVNHIELIRETYRQLDIRVGYYRTEPTISAVILDDKAISISWYRCYKDPGRSSIVRIRGHDSNVINGAGEASSSLILFAKGHFNHLWRECEEINKWP